MKIDINVFKGIAPRFAPKMLGQNQAQLAENCDLDGGKLKPLRGLKTTDDTVPAATRSMYLWKYDYYEMVFDGITIWTHPETPFAFNMKIGITDFEFRDIFIAPGTTPAQFANIIQETIREKTSNYETFTAEFIEAQTEEEEDFWRYRLSSTLLLETAPTGTALPSPTGNMWFNFGAAETISVSQKKHREWISWESYTQVVNSTVFDDQLSRFYYIDNTSGKLKVKGTFGERDVSMPIPGENGNGGISKIENIASWIAVAEKMVSEDAVWRWKSTHVPGYPISDEAVDGPSYGTIYDYNFFKNDDTGEEGIEIGLIYSGYAYDGYILDFCAGKDPWLQLDGVDYPSLHFNCGIPLSSIQIPVRNNQNEVVGYLIGDGYLTSDSAKTATLEQPVQTESTHAYSAAFAAKAKFTMIYGTDAGVSGVYTKEDFYYVMRYVTDTGEEGPPSIVSDMATRTPDGVLKLTMAAPTGLPSYIKKKRLYRSAGTADAAYFYFLAELDVSATEYSDTSFVTDLVERMPGYGNPPDDMEGLAICANSFLAGFKGRDLFFSDTYRPYQWPWKYNITVDEDIVGIASRRNSLMVITTSGVWQLVGDYPEELSAIKSISNQGCINKRCITTVGNDIFYPSPDGLMRIGAGTPVLISNELLRKSDWETFYASFVGDGDMLAIEYNGKYVSFGGNGGFILNISSGSLTTHTIEASAAYYDAAEDILFLSISGNISEYDNTGIISSAKWHSQEFESERPVNFSVAQIVSRDIADAADKRVTLKVYARGALSATLTITGEDAVRLPMLRDERDWSFAVETPIQIDSLTIASSMSEV